MKNWLFLVLAISAPLLAHTGPHVFVPPVAGIVIDGDFADWPKDIEWHAIESPDPKSLTARFAVGVDRARDLRSVAVDVTDDMIVLEGPGQRALAPAPRFYGRHRPPPARQPMHQNSNCSPRMRE